MGKRKTAAAAAAAAAAEEAARLQSEEPFKARKGGTAKFKKGSKVLVKYTDQYYAAVVMQGQKQPDGQQQYMVHYEGWSNKYNEWVKEAEVVRFDRALLEKSAADAGNEPGDLTGRRRRVDAAPVEQQMAVEVPQQLRLHIPPLLKKVVLDDSTQVNTKGKVLPLPRSAHGRPTLSDILKEYEAAVAKAVPKDEQADLGGAEAAREMVHGIRRYFDQGLRHFLLYSHELQQADSLLGTGGGSDVGAGRGGGASEAGGRGGAQARPPPCDVYGAEHLVRLFVKLPELFPVAYMTAPDVARTEQALHHLLAHMTEVKRHARYFSLPEEYQANPHFSPLALGLLGPGAPGTPGSVPAVEAVLQAVAPARGRGGDGTPGHTSEAADMEQD